MFKTIDNLIEKRKAILSDFEKITKGDLLEENNKKSQLRAGLLAESQQAVISILHNVRLELSPSTVAKIVENQKQLQTAYIDYAEKYDKINKDWSFSSLKEEFDLNNKYFKLRSYILKDMLRLLREDLKSNNPEMYKEYNNKVFKNLHSELDLVLGKNNKIKNEIALLLHNNKPFDNNK